MKNFLIGTLFVIALYSCESGNSRISDYIIKDTKHKIEIETKQLNHSHHVITSFGGRFIPLQHITLVDSIHKVLDDIDSLNLITSKEIIKKLVIEFYNQKELSIGQDEKDVVLKHFELDLSALKTINSNKETSLLNQLNLLNITKGVNIFYLSVLDNMMGDGMVVTDLRIITSIDYDGYSANNDSNEVKVSLHLFNKNFSPNIYLGEIDSSKLDLNEPDIFTKGKVLSSIPLRGKKIRKLKSKNGIITIKQETEELSEKTIQGVVEIPGKYGIKYIPFKSK